MPAWYLYDFLRGLRPVLLKNDIVAIFQGDQDPMPPPPLEPRMFVNTKSLVNKMNSTAMK